MKSEELYKAIQRNAVGKSGFETKSVLPQSLNILPVCWELSISASVSPKFYVSFCACDFFFSPRRRIMVYIGFSKGCGPTKHCTIKVGRSVRMLLVAKERKPTSNQLSQFAYAVFSGFLFHFSANTLLASCVDFVLRIPSLVAKCLQQFQIQCCSTWVQGECFSPFYHTTKIVCFTLIGPTKVMCP